MQLWKKLFNIDITGPINRLVGTLDMITGSVWKIGGTQVTATATELNTVVGNTASGAEINRVAKASARIITTTATTLSLTVTQHAERVVLVQTNSTVANTLSLPTATGSGVKFTIVNDIVQTQGSVVVQAVATTDTMKGMAVVTNSTVTNMSQAFASYSTATKVTLNNTTTGGKGGDVIECWDVAANRWLVEVKAAATGTVATPFS